MAAVAANPQIAGDSLGITGICAFRMALARCRAYLPPGGNDHLTASSFEVVSWTIGLPPPFPLPSPWPSSATGCSWRMPESETFSEITDDLVHVRPRPFLQLYR